MPLPSLPREEARHEETSHLFPKRVKGFPGSLLATAGRIAGLGGMSALSLPSHRCSGPGKGMAITLLTKALPDPMPSGRQSNNTSLYIYLLYILNMRLLSEEKISVQL